MREFAKGNAVSWKRNREKQKLLCRWSLCLYLYLYVVVLPKTRLSIYRNIRHAQVWWSYVSFLGRVTEFPGTPVVEQERWHKLVISWKIVAAAKGDFIPICRLGSILGPNFPILLQNSLSHAMHTLEKFRVCRQFCKITFCVNSSYLGTSRPCLGACTS